MFSKLAKEGFNYLPNGMQRTLDGCGLPDNYIRECRPKTVGGAGNRIYLANKTDIASFTENGDGSIASFTYVGANKFIAIDCLPNQNGLAVTGNGADGAGSLNYTPAFTFAVESWKQETINILDKLFTTRGLVLMYTTGEITDNNEPRLFAVGFTGDGLQIPTPNRAGPGTAKTDPTGFQITLSGTLIDVSKEITPASGTNAQFIADNLTTPV